jgi:adhesin HecA-like repeat protein
LYFGSYILPWDPTSSGKMELSIASDGTAWVTPKDVNAGGVGTIDADGGVDVTTGYDSFAQGSLRFRGTATLDADAGIWRASGDVVGPNVNAPGTWTVTKD